MIHMSHIQQTNSLSLLLLLAQSFSEEHPRSAAQFYLQGYQLELGWKTNYTTEAIPKIYRGKCRNFSENNEKIPESDKEVYMTINLSKTNKSRGPRAREPDRATKIKMTINYD